MESHHVTFLNFYDFLRSRCVGYCLRCIVRPELSIDHTCHLDPFAAVINDPISDVFEAYLLRCITHEDLVAMSIGFLRTRMLALHTALQSQITQQTPPPTPVDFIDLTIDEPECVLRPPSDDHQSDTSGETTTSDSGRGGSEEDIQLPPLPENCEDTSRIIFRSIGSGLKDSRFVQSDHPDARDKDSIAFETFSPRTLPSINGHQERLPAVARDVQTLNNTDRHDKRWLNKKGIIPYDAQSCHNSPSYLSPSGKQQQHYHQQHSSLTSGPGQYPHHIPDRGDPGVGGKKVTFQTDLTTQNLKTWDLCQKMNAQPASMYLSPTACHGSSAAQRIPYGSKSRNQDDDDNTTTSGSYTISPENDLDDILTVSFPAA